MMNTPTPPPRPKRPLSAYNLFYRFKREKIVKVQATGNEDIEIIRQIIMAPPGLEDYYSIGTDILSSSEDAVRDIRRNTIRSSLVNNLAPKDTSKRSHRKSLNAMSFLEMSKLMCDSWKNTDKFGQGIFQELAVEGRLQHKKRVAEYNEMYPSAAAGSSSPSPKKKAKKTFRRHSMDIMISEDQIKNLRVNDPSVNRTRNDDIPSSDHQAVVEGNFTVPTSLGSYPSPSPTSVRSSFFDNYRRTASCGDISADIPSYSFGGIPNIAAPTHPPPAAAPAQLDHSIDSIDIEDFLTSSMLSVSLQQNDIDLADLEQEASEDDLDTLIGNPTASSFEDDEMLNTIIRQNEEKQVPQPEASADDFLKLIATLNTIG